MRWRYAHDEPWFDNQVASLRAARARAPRFTLEKTEPPPGEDGTLKLDRVFERPLTRRSANRSLLANLRHASGPVAMIRVSEPSGEATHRVTRTDAELLQAARQDPQAFREFYDRYAVWMRAWLVRQTGSETAALDLTAETFAQAWHASRRFKDMAGGSGAPWLFGIARNLVRQYHKHNRIETAARERLGLPLAFAECEDYERVDDRIAAQRDGPGARSAGRCAARASSVARWSCGSSSSSTTRRSPAASGAARTPPACAYRAACAR